MSKKFKFLTLFLVCCAASTATANLPATGFLAPVLHQGKAFFDDGSSLKKKAPRSLLKLNFKEKKQAKGSKNADAGERKFNILAIVGFIFSVTGIFFFGYALGFLGAILCGLALGQIKSDPEQTGRWLAIAGLVLGILVMVGWIMYLAILSST